MLFRSITPRQTKFETNKEKLRQTIRAALSAATSFENFSSLLLREGVAVKESRGRLSYLTPDRTKPITARKLGDDFDRAAVLAVLEQNAARAAEKATAIPEYPRHGKTGIQPVKAPQSAPKQDGVQRLVDIEQKMAEGKGKGYEHWAKIHNIKQMAKTLNVYQQYGFTSPEQLEAAFVWLKQNKSGKGFFLGLGWWTRSNAEICLLAVKGKPKRKNASVRQLVFAPIEQHSKKPDIVRDRILELMGDLPRIELFARQASPGWDVWGNEVNSSIEFP